MLSILAYCMFVLCKISVECVLGKKRMAYICFIPGFSNQVSWKSVYGYTEQSGAVYAVKLYPAGATTNSQAGVTDLFGKCLPALHEMINQGLPLLVNRCCSVNVIMDHYILATHL